MKAVDTNVLARLLLQDDAKQLPLARAVLAQGVWIPITVLLELGWLLKSRYRFSRRAVVNALTTLLDHPKIVVADEDAVRQSLPLLENGADFADILHLVAARGSEAFVTFDHDVPDAPALGVTVERLG